MHRLLAASEDVRAAKAAWKALKAQGADKAVVKSAKAKYKAAKERKMNARAGATSARRTGVAAKPRTHTQT